MIDLNIGYMDQRYLLALINLVLCFAITWICVCRFRLMDHTTRKSFRLKYTMLFAAAVFSMGSPAFVNAWPGYPDIAFAGAVLFHLSAGRFAWLDRAPDYTYTDAAPFNGEPECRT